MACQAAPRSDTKHLLTLSTMKKTLFLTALLCATSHLHAAVGDTLNLTNGFVADGVITKYTPMNDGTTQFSVILQSSTRFYDSTKGWATSLPSDDYGNTDSRMCWAHTASNMIQYWQSYYGVFYKQSKELPYGTDYTRTVTTAFGTQYTIADPMRLNVAQDCIKGAKNQAGKVYDAIDYFFTYEAGGYYSDYFGKYTWPNPPQTSVYTETLSTQQELKDALLPALGISESNGQYIQSEAGLIAHLNGTVNGGAHTLTCYGVTLDSDGNIKSLYYADSDDNQLSGGDMDSTKKAVLKEAYVSLANGSFYLYSDETRKTPIFTGGYAINGLTYIKTPDVLKNMLAEYSDTANEALVWNGGESGVWKNVAATTEQLPTKATGWDVLVNGDNIEEQQHRGYYHSYAEDGRAVVFDTHGMNGSTETQVVTVTGKVSPGTITVTEGGNYHLQAGTGAAIAGSGDVSIESGGKLSSEINFGSRTITARSGGHFAYAATADMTLNGQISGESGSTIQFRNGSSATGVKYSYTYTNGQLASNTVNSIKGTLVIGDRQDTMATHVDFSTAYDGYMNVENLVLNGASSLNTAGTTVVTGTFSSLKTLQDANTLNLRAAANTSATPIIHDSLDLSGAKALVMETAVSLDEYGYNETLKLSKTNRLALTLDLESFGISVTPGKRFDVALFTHVDSLTLDNPPDDNGDGWAAADYFTSEYIDASTRLVWADGTVSLVGLTVPEPATATLSLLALAALAARRRRR